MRFVGFALVASACSPTIAVRVVPPIETWQPHLPTITASPDDVDALRKATLETIRDPKFAALVAKRDDLRGKMFSGEIQGGVVAVAYWGVSDHLRMVPSTIVEDDPNGNAVTDEPTTLEGTRIVLSHNAMNNWRAGDEIHKSCAVNTLAHELTHTVVDIDANQQVHQAFKDSGHRWWNYLYIGHRHHFVSYGVGSIAQCVYLENKQIVKPSQMDACIEHWGVWDTVPCDPDWKP